MRGWGKAVGVVGVGGALGCGHHLPGNLGTAWGQADRLGELVGLLPSWELSPAGSVSPHPPLPEAPSFSPWSKADRLRMPWREVRMGPFGGWVCRAFCSSFGPPWASSRRPGRAAGISLSCNHPTGFPGLPEHAQFPPALGKPAEVWGPRGWATAGSAGVCVLMEPLFFIRGTAGLGLGLGLLFHRGVKSL